MMKMNQMQAKSFITLDLPLDNRYLSALFNSTHQQHLLNSPYWNIRATRKKIISRYWFEFVSIHFAILCGLAVLISLPFIGELNRYFWAGLLIAGSFSFPVLLVTQYWPRFYSDLLPKLDSIVDEYESRQKEEIQRQWLKEIQNRFVCEYEQLARQREELAKEGNQLELQQKELIKCRKEQYSILTLALILYVFDKTSGMNTLQCNDRSAALLTKLFGKDQGGIKDNLQLILGKRQELSARHRTEILNRFSEAYTFFKEMQFAEGIRLLRSLEVKFKD